MLTMDNAMKNVIEIDGHKAVIAFDPESQMLRGEFVGPLCFTVKLRRQLADALGFVVELRGQFAGAPGLRVEMRGDLVGTARFDVELLAGFVPGLHQLLAFLLALLEALLESAHFFTRAFDVLHQSGVHRLRRGKLRLAFGAGGGERLFSGAFRLFPGARSGGFGFVLSDGRQIFDQTVGERVKRDLGLTTGGGIKRHRVSGG